MAVYSINSIFGLLDYFSAKDRILPARMFNTQAEADTLDMYRNSIRELYDDVHGQIFADYEARLKTENAIFPQDDEGRWFLEGYQLDFDVDKAAELLADFAAYVVYLAQGYKYRVQYEDDKLFPMQYAVSSILNQCSFRHDLNIQNQLLTLLQA